MVGAERGSTLAQPRVYLVVLYRSTLGEGAPGRHMVGYSGSPTSLLPLPSQRGIDKGEETWGET
jgi:hypothetical protein